MKKAWEFLGTSNAWLVILIIAFIFEAVLGSTLLGMFYVFIAFLGFFLSRIAEAIEANNK